MKPTAAPITSNACKLLVEVIGFAAGLVANDMSRSQARYRFSQKVPDFAYDLKEIRPVFVGYTTTQIVGCVDVD